MESQSLFRKKLEKRCDTCSHVERLVAKHRTSAQYDREQLIRETLAIKSEAEQVGERTGPPQARRLMT